MDYETIEAHVKFIVHSSTVVHSPGQQERFIRGVRMRLLHNTLGYARALAALSHAENAEPETLALAEDLKAVLVRYGVPKDETQLMYLQGDLIELIHEYKQRNTPCIPTIIP